MESIPDRIREFFERGVSKAAFAREVGVSPAAVSQWLSGVRPVPVERCARIEEASGGEIRRWDLRPDDWHEIWPELIGAPGAPDVPAGEKVA